MPQIFLSRAASSAGSAGCTRPAPGLLAGHAGGGESRDCSPFEAAALAHDAVMRGGGPMSVDCATELLREAGFVEAT